MKSKKLKKIEKIKPSLSQKTRFKLKNSEMTVLVLICIVFVEISIFGNGKTFYEYIQKNERNSINSIPEMKIVKSAIAAENQDDVNIPNNENNALLKESKYTEVTLEEINSALDQADREEKTEMIARHQHAAEVSLINNAPILAGRTNKLSNGLRVCPVKSLHPQRGGKTHVDEDCCADYNEYPNPRCSYSPKEWAILKH